MRRLRTSSPSQSPSHDHERRRFVAFILAGGAIAPLAACTSASPDVAFETEPGLRNPLSWAVAWRETAAEFGALCHQAYNLARLRVEMALQKRTADDRPLAVIADLDDTVFHASSYWGHLINESVDFFDDAIWDEWLPSNLVTAVPGSIEFLEYCLRNDVEVFYVTSRDQGEQTFDLALRQLESLGFPYADPEHLTVYRETSDKTPTREQVESRYDLVLMLGDNLNDYKRDYYVADVDDRYALMERDRDEYGDRFILLPNPTDGHWVRAIFGESEPAATDENRRTLRAAAARSAWVRPQP
ncbi:MAG: 5'-nucleotidase, lipoprotein e(P4) family [Gemmatimonadota bacterium]